MVYYFIIYFISFYQFAFISSFFFDIVCFRPSCIISLIFVLSCYFQSSLMYYFSKFCSIISSRFPMFVVFPLVLSSVQFLSSFSLVFSAPFCLSCYFQFLLCCFLLAMFLGFPLIVILYVVIFILFLWFSVLYLFLHIISSC